MHFNTWIKALLISSLISAQAFANVSAYFNQNKNSSYIDPYRQIHRQGDNLEAIILKEMDKAKVSIFVAVQEIRLPTIALKLVEKKKQGLDVRVVIEHDYNFTSIDQREVPEGQQESTRLSELKLLVDVNRNGKIEKSELETRDAIYILKTNNIPLIDDKSDISLGSGLMHHKFVVIDSKTTIVSTANFTMSCIHGDFASPDSRGNANSMMVVSAKNFSDIFSEEFSQMWGNGKRGNFGLSKTYRGPKTVMVRGTKMTVQFSPTSRRFRWEETVNGLIANSFAKATKSFKAALFVFSDQRIADELEKRNDAGVSIGVLIEQTFAYRDYSELMDILGVEMLTQKCEAEPGNRPWKKPSLESGKAILPRGDKLHHKFAVVDDKAVTMGSQNWSENANYVNDETLMVVENATIAQQYDQEYERLKSKALLGVPPSLKNEISKIEKNCHENGPVF